MYVCIYVLVYCSVFLYVSYAPFSLITDKTMMMMMIMMMMMMMMTRQRSKQVNLAERRKRNVDEKNYVIINDNKNKSRTVFLNIFLQKISPL